MNKKIWNIICVVLIVAGAVTAYFSNIAWVDVTALAVSFGSAGVLCASMFNKQEKKNWLFYLSVVLIALGSFGVCFAGASVEVLPKIIESISGFIFLIAGIIGFIFSDKLAKKEEAA